MAAGALVASAVASSASVGAVIGFLVAAAGFLLLLRWPGERWKVSKAQPLPNSFEIELDKNSIKEGG